MVARLSWHTRSLPSGQLHLLHAGCCILTLQLLYAATHAFTVGSISTNQPPLQRSESMPPFGRGMQPATPRGNKDKILAKEGTMRTELRL